MEIFYISLFRVLVPIYSISVSWIPTAHLVLLSYIFCLQNLFEATKITERDEEEANREETFLGIEASDD